MASTTQRIRIAFFGKSAAGKTTLASSYFGHQQRHAFEKAHGYRLSAVDARDGNRLLKNYYGMEAGQFPDPTTGADHTYRFEFKITGLPQPAFVLDWIDYPGGWWDSEPSEPEEKERKRKCILSLMSAHVGVLLIDGAEYGSDRGRAFLRQTLDEFRHEIRRWQDVVEEEHKEKLPVIEEWVIALTKADRFPRSFTAKDFYRQLLEDASEQLDGLTEAVHGLHEGSRDKARSSFGKRFLLLSSAQADPADPHRVRSVEETIGLELIAPAALASILERVAEKHAEVAAPRLSWWQRALLAIHGLVSDRQLETSADKRYASVLLLLKAIGEFVQFDVEQKASALREQQRALAAEGRIMAASATAMRAEQLTDAGQRAYFQSQAE